MNSFKVFNLILIIFCLQNSNAFNALFKHKNCLKKQCFPELGCFSVQTFIDEAKELLTSTDKLMNSVQTLLTLKQLLSICPISPDVMNATFILFTKYSNESQKFSYNPTEDEMKNSMFSDNKKTVLIIHGYTDSYEECVGNDCRWMAKMKNYFVSNDYNVFAVDWSIPAFDLNYFNSAFNTQIVGSIVAFFIKRLVEVFGVKTETFQLIGHSLGAHVCGFAGKRFNASNKIGHISGLDPAGPGFSRNRLSPDDANLVITIHTSAGLLKDVDENIGENPIESLQLSGTLGCPDPLGHFDFWPNGGNGQPGCEKLTKQFFGDIISNGINGLKERGGCSHQRATQLPIAQSQLGLVSDEQCQMIGYLCDNYEDFNDGKCADCDENGVQCKPLEFSIEFWSQIDNWKNQLNTFPNNFHFKTSESEPFCLYHYRIAVSIGEFSGMGQIRVTLIGRKNIELYFNEPLVGFKSGENYTKLYTDSKHLGQITEAIIVFDNNLFGKLIKFGKNLYPLGSRKKSNIKINKIEIKFMSNIEKSIRDKYSSELFPDYDNSENQIENSVIFKLRK